MLLALFVLGLAGGASEVPSPLQLCVADEIRVAKRYEMRATGHVRCTAGPIFLTGQEAVVTANQDESLITIEIKGQARLQHQGDTIGADRITAQLAHLSSGDVWSLSAVHAVSRLAVCAS